MGHMIPAPESASGVPQGNLAPPSKRRRFRLPMILRTAALIAVVPILLVAGNRLSVRTVTTDVGQQKSIPLDNVGSSVLLNTDTEVRISQQDNSIRVDLMRGEALFDMRPNKRRQLLVTARDSFVTETDTVFCVRILENGEVRVTVESGSVYLASARIGKTQLIQNQQASIDYRDHPESLHKAALSTKQTRDLLAWRHGGITFWCDTVSGAIEEFSRYSRTKIALLGPFSDERIGGEFTANDPQAFATLVTVVYPYIRLEIDTSDPDHRILKLISSPPAQLPHKTYRGPQRQCKPAYDSRL